MKRGPIKIPDFEDDPRTHVDIEPLREVLLPPKEVLDAGVAKFYELVKLNWPNSANGFQLVQFDLRNEQQIRITLGAVFMAMRDAAER